MKSGVAERETKFVFAGFAGFATKFGFAKTRKSALILLCVRERWGRKEKDKK